MSIQILWAQIPDSIRAEMLLTKIKIAPEQTSVDSLKEWYKEAAFGFAIGKHWKSGSSTLRKGAEFLLKHNQTQEAKEWIEQAEAWDAEYQGTKNLVWANVMEYGAYLNQKNKDEKTAFNLWKDCLEIRKKLLFISDPTLYKTYYELGSCAEKNGEWETARECLLTCQALTNQKEEKLKFSLKTAEISMNLMDYRQALYSYLPLVKSQKDSILYSLFIAECYLELNSPDSAGKWLELWYSSLKFNLESPNVQGFLLQARKAIMEKNTRTALNWIREARTKTDSTQKINADLDIAEGEVWEELSLLDNAEKCYQSAYQWNVINKPNGFSQAFCAWKLGQMYVRKRQFSKALTYLNTAYSVFLEILGNNAIQTNEIRFQIAEILHEQDDYSHALGFTQEILSVKNHDPAFHQLRKKSLVLETKMKLKLYEQYHDVQLLKVCMQMNLKALDEMVQESTLNLSEFRLLIEKTLGLQLELFARTLDSTWLYQAWNLTDQNRLVQARFINQNKQKMDVKNEIGWLIDQQQMTYKNLWKRAFSGKLSIWELNKLHDKLDSIQNRVSESVKHDSIITCDWTCKPWKINNEKYVLNYFIGQENQFVFYSNTKKISFKTLGNQANREEKVMNFRKSILFRDFSSFVTLSYKLYEDLMMNIVQADLKNIKKLVISPDSYLFYLPFDALATQMVTPETPYNNIPYLINKMEISYSVNYPTNKNTTVTQNIAFFLPNMVDSLRKRASQEGFTIVQTDLSIESDTITRDGTAKWLKPGTSNQLSQIQENNFVQWNIPAFIKEDQLLQSGVFLANGFFKWTDLQNFSSAGVSFSGIEWSLSHQNKGIGMLFLIEQLKSKTSYMNIPLWKMDSAVKLRIQLYKNIKINQPNTALRLSKLSVLKEKNTVPYDWAGLTYYEMP